MRKKLILWCLLLQSTIAVAQSGNIGINTSSPKSTLDISAKTDALGNPLATDITGLQAPRLTLAQLTIKGNSLYGTDQKGALVYITDVSGGDKLSQRINITNVGYYYFDGTLWQKVGAGSSSGTPFYIAAASPSVDAGSDKSSAVVRTGAVGIGTNTVDTSALFELKSTTQGVLIPRMSTAQRIAISSPAEGLMVHDSDLKCTYIYTSSNWKPLCDNLSGSGGTATYDVTNCNNLTVSGTYTQGTALSASNYITIDVNVINIGTYSLSYTTNGMTFSKNGSFTATGLQSIQIPGSGTPNTFGTFTIPMAIGSGTCNAVINVGSNLATVSTCGSIGTVTGALVVDTPITTTTAQITNIGVSGGGSNYQVIGSTLSGIQIATSSGQFSGANPYTITVPITGTPTQTGTIVLPYTINGTSCTLSVPVTTGTGRASAVDCATGALSGAYTKNVAMAGTNTKVIGLTVSTAGSFTIVSDTQNGVRFKGTAASLATGAQTITLTAEGTPVNSGSYTYTIQVSTSATSFVACQFSVTFGSVTNDGFSVNCTTGATNASYVSILSPNPDRADGFGSMVLSDISINSTSGTNSKVIFNTFAGIRPVSLAEAPQRRVSMSTDGLIMAVGAPGEDGSLVGVNPAFNNSGNNNGAVYIYTRPNLNTVWTYQAYIKPSYTFAGDLFGWAVSLNNDGTSLVVSAPSDDSNATGVGGNNNNQSATNSGGVYVFSRSGTTWTQETYIKGQTNTANQGFGWSTGISGDGNTIAVSYLGTASWQGKVDVFRKSGGSWAFAQQIIDSNLISTALFGVALDLSNDGNAIVIGAPGQAVASGSEPAINPSYTSSSTTGAGLAFIYRYNGSSFVKEVALSKTTISSFKTTAVGNDVSISADGNIVVVGNSYHAGGSITGINPTPTEGASNSYFNGTAMVYRKTGGSWSLPYYLMQDISPQPNSYFGYGVDISKDGTKIAVIASNSLNPTSTSCSYAVNYSPISSWATNQGTAWLFQWDGTNWFYNNKYQIPSPNYFAGPTSCSIGGYNGTSIAIGATVSDGGKTGVNNYDSSSSGTFESGGVFTFTKQ